MLAQAGSYALPDGIRVPNAALERGDSLGLVEQPAATPAAELWHDVENSAASDTPRTDKPRAPATKHGLAVPEGHHRIELLARHDVGDSRHSLHDGHPG